MTIAQGVVLKSDHFPFGIRSDNNYIGGSGTYGGSGRVTGTYSFADTNNDEITLGSGNTTDLTTAGFRVDDKIVIKGTTSNDITDYSNAYTISSISSDKITISTTDLSSEVDVSDAVIFAIPRETPYLRKASLSVTPGVNKDPYYEGSRKPAGVDSYDGEKVELTLEGELTKPGDFSVESGKNAIFSLLMGKAPTTGSISDSTSHAGHVPSFTLYAGKKTVGDNGLFYTFEGCQIDNVKVDSEAPGVVTVSVDIIAKLDRDLYAADPTGSDTYDYDNGVSTLSFPSTRPFRSSDFSAITFTSPSLSESTYMKKFSLEFANNLDDSSGFAHGTSKTYENALVPGEWLTSGSITFSRIPDNTVLEDLGLEDPHSGGTVKFDSIQFTMSKNSGSEYLDFQFSDCFVKPFENKFEPGSEGEEREIEFWGKDTTIDITS